MKRVPYQCDEYIYLIDFVNDCKSKKLILDLAYQSGDTDQIIKALEKFKESKEKYRREREKFVYKLDKEVFGEKL